MELAPKMRFDLWAATSYGQNLDVKELSGRNLDHERPKRDGANSAHRHCLGYVRARSGATQGQMSH